MQPPLSTPNFDYTLVLGMVVFFFCIKMTRKDDPTISCSHLIVELSVFASRKINLREWYHPLFGMRGLIALLSTTQTTVSNYSCKLIVLLF